MNTDFLFENHRARGNQAFQDQNYQLMLSYHLKALTIKPTSKEANESCIKAFRILKKFLHAETAIRSLLHIYRDDNTYQAKLQPALGDILLEQGKYEEAKSILRTQLERNRGLEADYHNSGMEGIKAEKYEKARVYFELLTERANCSQLTLNCLGYAYFHQGDFGLAIETYKKAIKKERGYNLAYLNWSLALVCNQRTDKALDTFKKGVRDTNFDGLQRMVRIYEEELKRAEERLEKIEDGEKKSLWETKHEGIKYILGLLKNEIESSSETAGVPAPAGGSFFYKYIWAPLTEWSFFSNNNN